MMSQPTEIRILKGFGLTTKRAARSQSALRRQQKLTAHGEQKICEDKWLILKSLEPSAMEDWFDSPVADAEKLSPLLITKITTNRLKLFGFANLVTNNAIKK